MITSGFAHSDTEHTRFRDLKSDCASYTWVMYLVFESVGGGRPWLLREKRDPWRLGLTPPIPDEMELSLLLSLGTGDGRLLNLVRLCSVCCCCRCRPSCRLSSGPAALPYRGITLLELWYIKFATAPSFPWELFFCSQGCNSRREKTSCSSTGPSLPRKVTTLPSH